MRRTKIICTVGPATESVEMLRKLVDAGADVFRLNFSHGTVSGHQSMIRRIRDVAEETGKPFAILQDLPGPKIRLGVFKDGSVELHAGDRFRLTTDEVPRGSCYAKLPDEVRPGQSILLADGTVDLEVESAAPREIVCRVVLGGVLTNHKGVNAVAWMAWKSGRRSSLRRSSWPLRPIRRTTRRPQCRGLGRRGARYSTSTPLRRR